MGIRLIVPTNFHADGTIMAAKEIAGLIENGKKEKELKHEIAFEISICIHTDPVVAGVVGARKFSYDIWCLLQYRYPVIIKSVDIRL